MSSALTIPDSVKALIGVEKVRRHQVTDRDIRRFAQAIGDTDPVYASGKGNGADGALVAPPLFCQSLAYEDVAPELLPPDGSPVEIDLPLPARRAVGGGSEYTIFRRVHAGDVITVITRLADVSAKSGRSGVLYFVVIQTDFLNQLGQPVAKEIATFIKRI